MGRGKKKKNKSLCATADGAEGKGGRRVCIFCLLSFLSLFFSFDDRVSHGKRSSHIRLRVTTNKKSRGTYMYCLARHLTSIWNLTACNLTVLTGHIDL